MTARLGKDPAELYKEINQLLGDSFYKRDETSASSKQKEDIKNLSAKSITMQTLAGSKIKKILTSAPGDHAPLGGIKIETKDGWLAARPSGTEEIYKIYAESFVSDAHLQTFLKDGQKLIQNCIEKTH
jgi:phosphoglucomutase